MLFTLRCLHSRIKLPADTQIRKGKETGVSAAVVVSHRLEQPDHPLLNQIFIVSAQDKHGFRLTPYQVLILVTDIIHDRLFTAAQPVYQFLIRHAVVFLISIPAFQMILPFYA